jgi:hypothetical protein
MVRWFDDYRFSNETAVTELILLANNKVMFITQRFCKLHLKITFYFANALFTIM